MRHNMSVTGSRAKSEIAVGTEGDSELVSRLQAGDASAFDEVVARYKNRIFNFVYRMCRRREAAEDITQEVFVRVFVQARAIRRDSSFASWLYRVAGNLCIDEHRKTQTRKAVVSRSLDQPLETESGSLEMEVPDVSAEPERELLRGELGRKVQDAIDSLPDKLRIALLLNDQEGLSYEEIARVLNVPVGTVKSRLFNARMALKDTLADYVLASTESEGE